jgi:hypothetical protein
VSNGGVGVGDATVTVNGVVADADGAGAYVVNLLPNLPTGGVLNVVVKAGGQTISATGTVPAGLDVTGPVDSAALRTIDRVDVTWTSDTDPDRFQVQVVGPDVKEFDVAGTRRAYSIPAGEIVAGEWEIRVYAYNEGTLTGSIEPESFIHINNASGVMDRYPRVAIVPAVLVVGSDMGNQAEHVSLSQEGTADVLANVTVNGEAAFQSVGGGSYDVTFAAPVATGGVLDLKISFGMIAIQGTGAVPETPVVTAPADVAVIPVANAIDVTWTSATNPDRFVVTADIGATLRFDAAGTSRALTIPAGALPVGGPWQIRVYAYNDGTFTGPVAVASRMNIRGEGTGYPNVTISP